MTLYHLLCVAVNKPGFEGMKLKRDEIVKLLACVYALTSLNAIADDEPTYWAWAEEFDAAEDALREVGV